MQFRRVDMGLPFDTAVVELPGITVAQVEARTGWKQANDDCQLGHHDVQQAFGEDGAEQWAALTWDGRPAVCKADQNQAPEEILVRGQTTYDLFTADNGGDALSGYL